MVIEKNLGPATAYGYAKEKGYTGTEEEFAELMASYASVAQDAAQSAADAESAKDDAVTAKNDAVSAKNDAVTAKNDAVSAKNDAVSAKDDAVIAKNAAQAAQTAAETAQSKAETAQGKAEDAEQGAEDALVNAGHAVEDAESAAESSEAWAVGQKNGVDVPTTDPTYHNNSKYYAEQAADHELNARQDMDSALNYKRAAEAAKDDAVSAKNDAVTAKNDAVTAKNDAVTAKNDAVTAKNAAQAAQTAAETAQSKAEAAQAAAEAVVGSITAITNAEIDTIWNSTDDPITATVAGLGSENPADVTFTKSPFFTPEDLGIEEVTMGGDTFIKIPTMYRKVNTVESNQITSFTIANAKIDNDYKVYPVFLAEDGTTVLPYVLIGKYWNTNSSSMVSTTETSTTATMEIGTARTNARNRGTGYQQYDWMFWKLWQDLEIIFAETVNINSGSGVEYDHLGIYWTDKSFWIDGICFAESVIAVSNKPTLYTDSATVRTTGYYGTYHETPSSNGEIQSLLYDASYPFVNVPSAVVTNNMYDTYYCDSYSFTSESKPIRSNVGNTNKVSGSYFFGNSTWSSSLSARLCYRPV